MRIYIKISYDGSRFFGFQKQNSNKITIMGELQRAFSALGIEEQIVASGRTDKGVHATNQALHVDLPDFWRDLQTLQVMLNRHLNPFIFVKKIYPVKNYFHARFSPIKREYRYIFSHTHYNPLVSSFVHYYKDFNLEKLNEILALFKGKHDFEFFKKNGSDTKQFVKNIFQIKAIKYKNNTIICIKADGFLRSQIRMIISATLKVYEGKLTANQIKNQLLKKGIFTQSLSPPNGLYLHRIYYKHDIFL